MANDLTFPKTRRANNIDTTVQPTDELKIVALHARELGFEVDAAVSDRAVLEFPAGDIADAMAGKKPKVKKPPADDPPADEDPSVGF